MRVSLSFFVTALMLTFTGAVLASKPSQWPPVPSRLMLETPYGDLHVSSSDYVYESRLMLDDHDIEPLIKGLLNIPYAFSSPDFHVALVSINKGDNSCPFSYKWIVLKNDGYSVTPPFGSCSDAIDVSTKGTTFTLLTPNHEDPDKLDSYLYDGTNITQQTR